jgi:hypothetical protein
VVTGSGEGERAELSDTDLRAFVPRGSLTWLRDHADERYRVLDASLVSS